MEAIDAIMGRFSPLRLSEPGPSEAQLETILKAGARAPDNGRLRPFRFLIIEGDARARFGGFLADALARREEAATQEALTREAEKPQRTPLIIVVAAAVTPNPRVSELDQILAAAAAVENMLLAAHALGFAGVWRTGPAAQDLELKKALGFSDSDVLVGFVHIGALDARPPAASDEFLSLTRRLELR